MNILQVAQLLGGIRFGDVDGGNELLAIVVNELPTDVHIDTNNNGTDFINIYEELTIEFKKKLTGISLAEHNELLVDILNDIVYINTQKEKIKEQEEKARNFQYVVFMIILTIVSAWSVYRYHVTAEQILGNQYQSVFVDFIDSVSNIVMADQTKE